MNREDRDHKRQAAAILEGVRRHNDPVAVLYEEAVRRGEALAVEGGALAASTGQHTGRSPADKFIVRDADTDANVWWGANKAIDPKAFDDLRASMLDHAKGRDLIVQDLHAGADEAHRLKVRVFCEYAWHALFIRHLLIRPTQVERQGFAPDLTIIDLPSFKADPKRFGVRSETVIACDFTGGLILIGGTSYAGEMKKSVFTTLNYRLPTRGVMPMHCSANVGPGGDVALFFGLSGTGKTTLSADPRRTLIGDDEHGWSENGIFNFEGGCYAKAIKLSKEAEPEIYGATRRFATILENVVVDPATREPLFDDASLTENTRAAYPLDAIPNASPTGRAGHPRTVVMLTADAFGVMPPIAELTPEQAMYHFLSGYTAKVAGTEKGVSEPQATFSTCFGSPFMPRHPSRYGDLLRQLIAKHRTRCFLVNTGWSGGPYGVGQRMPLAVTRSLLAAALEGRLNDVPKRTDPWFGFAVPQSAPDVDPRILNPRETWPDAAAYDAQAAKLALMFVKNFQAFEPFVDGDVNAVAGAMRRSA